MRLSPRIHQLITKTAAEIFGKEAKIYLFGSRVDDREQGGDIDLAIETQVETDEFHILKIKFLTMLLRAGFDIKIDVIQYQPDSSFVDQLFIKEIQDSMIRL